MSLIAAYHANRVILGEADAREVRRLLLEQGEMWAHHALGVSRHVLLRAAAQLPVYDRDESTILAGLRALEQGGS